MAFKIRTDANALGVQRNLSDVNSQYGKTISRLSTGMRITTAGDSPAEFIASEDMRKDIASMDVSIRTLADNTNYIKTAEGALDEVSRLLRDARALALQSMNEPTMSQSQKDANDQQIQSISESITRIANSASYGSNKILNGASGIFAQSLSLYSVDEVSFSGVFGGNAITTNSTFTVSVTTAATKASTTAVGYGLNSVVGAGSFSINGINFDVSPTETAQDIWSRINELTSVTGVYVNYCAASGAAAGAATIEATEYGEKHRIDIVDPGNLLITGATSFSGKGSDVVGTVECNYDGTNTATVTFDRGEGKTLRDSSGNIVELTTNGAVNTGTYNGRIVIGSIGTKFQVGIRSTDFTTMSIGNYQATQLGRGAEGNNNLTSISVLSGESAATALNVIDKAIEDVSVGRGRLGNFQKNILESSTRSMIIARENLMISESDIRDADMAEEASELAKFNILQQSGISVLARSQEALQNVLRLIQ